MTQMNVSHRRAGATMDVYTGLLFAAFVVLLAGNVLVTLRNLDHSKVDGRGGGPITLIDK